MDALDHDDVVLADAERRANLATARLEVVARQQHLFAGHQAAHIRLEQGDVQRPQRFEVERAAGVARRRLAIDEVIIETDDDRIDALSHHLQRQPLGKRRFAGRRRPRDGHQPHRRLAAGNGPGDACQLPLVQSLGHHDDLRRTAAGDRLVERIDVADAHDRQPIFVRLEHLGQPRLVVKRLENAGPGAAGELQDKSLVVVAQIEQVQITGARHHEAVEVVAHAVQFVERQVVLAAAGKEVGLLQVALLLEKGAGLIEGDADVVDGQIGID